MIALRGIQKYFPSNGVTALDHADFDLRPGEIHALLGENGAGKSTLMHILAGHLIPGGGHIFIDGRETRFRSPADALAGGIGMVRQHPSLTPGFTVWEDCILGAEPRSAGYINRGTARKLVRALSERWHFDLPIDQPTGRLTVSQRQKAAVLALLFRNTKFLIFDEPTAVLSPLEAEGIFGLFRALRSGGKGIVLISHKLEETLGIADRVSVLRKGKTVAVMPAAALKPETLSALMFGGNTFSMEGLTQEIAQTTGTITLSVQNLSITAPGRPFIRGLSLDLPGGKILGIAGVRDSGLETLELALTGFLRPSGGRVVLSGRDLTGKDPRAFREAGMAYLSAGGAVAPRLPMGESIILHAHRRSRKGFWGRLGIMDRRFLDSWIVRIMNASGVSFSPKAWGSSFSGGMIQRVALARELAENTPFLVLSEPGWGLDRKSREGLARILRAAAQAGRGILIFSTDIDELVVLSDEILVLRNGMVSALVSLETLKGSSPQETAILAVKESIGGAMVGIPERTHV